MNWLIIHSSHNSGCCRSVAPWITVLSRYTLFTTSEYTLVWYSLKQGTTHRPTSHLAHLYIVPFLWPWEEHRWQWSLVDDFAGQCLLWWLLSRKTSFAPKLGLPTNLGVGRSWLFPASSIKFLTGRSLKSRWVYLVPHENNSIQLLSTVRSRKRKNNFVVHLKVRWLIEQLLAKRLELSTKPMCQLYRSMMWGFTGRLLSSQKFPSAGGGSMLARKLLVCPSKLMRSNLP